MKKKICLVGFDDYDATMLDALKQAVAGISNVWEAEFARDAEAAWDELIAQPCDALVTRMRLRGMTGAELLQKAAKRYPKTLRFVVGPVADQELIMNCVGGTHQFIAEPCDPRTLIATVQRGLALHTWLATDELQKLVPRFQRLPSLPATYFEILKQTESPSASVQSVGEVVARDPAVTARLLQMVNSAAFALDQKVTDPVHAVTLLGMETVKSLVLCLQVFSQSDQAKQAGVSFDQLWKHSAMVADFARKLALAETRNARLANDAFTAGLLHDVGRIVLASNLPKKYAALMAAAREHSRPIEAEEAEQLGVTHAQVGAYLLALWGMPAPLVEAAALHHTPDQTATHEFSVLTAVHVANVLAHEREPDAANPCPPQLNAAYLGELGLEKRLDVWRTALGFAPRPVTAPAAAEAAAEPPAPAPVVPAQPEAAPVASSWWLKLLMPAGAVAILVVGVLWSLRESGPSQPVEVQARTVAAPPGAAPQPFPQPETTPAEAVAQTPVAPEAKPAVQSPPAPAVATVPEVPLPAPPKPTRGFDSVKVQGILYGRNPTVIVNGKPLAVGSKINDVEILAIGPSSVTLESDGQEKTLRFK